MSALSSNRKPAPARGGQPALGRRLHSVAVGVLLAGTGVLTLGGVVAGAATTSQTTSTLPEMTLTASKGSTCSLVTPQQVKNALGMTVGRPRTQHSGNVTACFFPSKADPNAVTIRFQTQSTRADFTAARRQFAKHNGQTTTVTSFGYPAYAAVVPAGPPTQYTVYAISVLHDSTQLMVTAVNPVPLNAEEALARKILPLL